MSADAVTLDQLRVLSAIEQEGTFSAAAEVLHRTQGSVSYQVAQMERLLDVQLFVRTGRRPSITDSGRAMVRHARQVLGRVDRLAAAASSLAQGVEAEVAVAFDVLFPSARLADLAASFADRWPAALLSIHVGMLVDVVGRLVSGGCTLAVTADRGLPDSVVRRPCCTVELVAVAAASHPLAGRSLCDADLDEHAHLVLTGAQPDASAELLGVARGRKWRISDMGVRQDLLRRGLGWARMPRDRVQADLTSGALVALDLERWRGQPQAVNLAVAHRADSPPGPVGSWLLEALTEG
jgi:DNA-binding transcriptional LysR family regulator